MTEGESWKTSGKKYHNEVRRRNGRCKPARTRADRILVLTEAARGNLSGFVASSTSQLHDRAGAGAPRCCAGYSRSSRSQDGESERSGSEWSARCAERTCPAQHRGAPAQPQQPPVKSAICCESPWTTTDSCGCTHPAYCIAQAARFMMQARRPSVDGERREARRRSPRSYGRRKPNGCDHAETNTTPSWLTNTRRGHAHLDSRAA
jgi:hypothetical protein